MKRQPSRDREQLLVAGASACVCDGAQKKTLVASVYDGCLKCCSRHIRQSGKQVAGTTALIEAVKKGRLDIARLLLPRERGLEDQLGRTVIHHALLQGPAFLDEILREAEPEFHSAVQEMKEMACVCKWPSRNIREAVGKHCMGCCAPYLIQGTVFTEELIAQPREAGNKRLATVKIMTYLQRKLKVETGATELIYAVKNNLYDAAALLVAEQHHIKDRENRKASDYAASFYNPQLWALFPEEITPEYATDLEAAHKAPCICGGQAVNLYDAVDRNCLNCCARFTYWAKSIKQLYRELRYAIKTHRTDIVRLLRHTQTGIQEEEDQTSLMYAAVHGNLDAAELLVEIEKKIQNSDGWTALMFAAKHGREAFTLQMLPYETRIQDNNGRTALMHAIQYNRFRVAKALLPLELDLKDKEGRTAQDYAFRRNDMKYWRLFDPEITHRDGWQKHREVQTACACQLSSKSLIEAAIEGCVHCCEEFIHEAGKKVVKRTALIEATINDNIEIVKRLAELEARMQDQFGNTALIQAAYAGKLEIVKVLLPYEAGVVSNFSRTAMTEAVWNLHKDCVDVLRQSPEELRASNVTRAMLAAHDRDLPTLLQNRGEWGSVFDNGLTALNFAFLHGRASFVLAMTRDLESRRELSRGEADPQNGGFNLLCLAQFSDAKQRHSRLALGVFCTAESRNRSVVTTRALFEFPADEPCALWHVFCAPQIEDLRYILRNYSNDERALRGFMRLKNVGVIRDMEALRTANMRTLNKTREYLLQNPLKMKQVQLAKKQNIRFQRDEKLFAWRESEAEAAFNRNALLQARDAWCSAAPRRRNPPGFKIATKCASKLETNAAQICGGYFYLYGEMDAFMEL